MGEIAGVTEIDGRPVGAGEVGPVTTRMADAVPRARRRAHGVAAAAKAGGRLARRSSGRAASTSGRRRSGTSAGAGSYGANPVDASHRGVPVRRPDAVGRPRAGRPRRASPGRSRCRARHSSRRRTPGGSRSRSAASTTGPPYARKISTCCGVAEVGERRLAAHLRVRGDHVLGVADQERVGQRAEPVPADLRQQVVGHVLLVVHGRRRRAAGRSARRPRPATGSAGWPGSPPGPGGRCPVTAR